MVRRVMSRLLVAVLLIAICAPAAVWAHGNETHGPGAPLVLIHGLLGSPSTTWATAIPYFESQGYVQGETLFALAIHSTYGEAEVFGVLSDTAYAAAEIRKILAATGAAQVDLVGNSRGGLIVRMLTSGETAPLIRRAVTINTPHTGVLSEAKLHAMLDYAKVSPDLRAGFVLPPDLQEGSVVIKSMKARELRFSDYKVPALAIASIFVDGHNQVLHGHDGFVSVESQLAWPGALTMTTKIGITPFGLNIMVDNNIGIIGILTSIPHVVSSEAPINLATTYAFLADHDVKPIARPCEPECQDFSLLNGHWSQAIVQPLLPHLLPYEVALDGGRVFNPERNITRAEFVYGLVRHLDMKEQLRATAFLDIMGHWSLGYVESAVQAGLVSGMTADSFGPDRQLTRAEAATLIYRYKKLEPVSGPSRFADARGHWAEAFIEATAQIGIIVGDERGFRPNDPLKESEAAVILSRTFKQ